MLVLPLDTYTQTHKFKKKIANKIILACSFAPILPSRAIQGPIDAFVCTHPNGRAQRVEKRAGGTSSAERETGSEQAARVPQVRCGTLRISSECTDTSPALGRAPLFHRTTRRPGSGSGSGCWQFIVKSPRSCRLSLFLLLFQPKLAQSRAPHTHPHPHPLDTPTYRARPIP